MTTGRGTPSPEGGLFGGLDPTLTGLADHAGEDSGWLRERLQRVKGHIGGSARRLSEPRRDLGGTPSALGGIGDA